MKPDIHPKYFENAKVTCACGNVFYTGSTKEELRVDICSKCHPFYTGKQKLVDTARRVEKFKERAAKKQKTVRKKSEKKSKVARSKAAKAKAEK